ncbi:MAG TPA: glycosyltransferase family 4 protein [Vicinamibacterales bacterium]|nr:glycosyltransferase family 4 protein [Vicinamibacterales bacterium]
MTHLFICREFPPAAYPPGGIGTYVKHITGLLAKAGERVHVIAHRWEGAPSRREDLVDGRLVLHRVALDDQMPAGLADDATAPPGVPLALLASRFPAQAFAWQAAMLAESLVATEGIDVIEAQEWEAPLYYLQLRRALGLGPAHRPPCIVHIHSPSERIFAANGWDTAVADYAPAAALEEYCITAADAVLAPSRFVADETIARYALDPDLVTVVPYPRGETPVIPRSPQTWASGSICHVGRLELRKGVLEWADAIALVAADQPGLQFDFVGGDTPVHVTGGATVGRAMLARLPRSVRRQVHFHGTRDRAGVMAVLASARAAVVPSRWENFPNSCIESMSTGLPVIVSPNGGMREMLRDGVSGWVAADVTAAGLAQALRRALAVSGSERQHMGQAAAEAIRQLCDNDAIVGRHLELKSRLARFGTRRAPAIDGTATAPLTGGLAVVVAGGEDVAALERCLASLRAQTLPPVAVRVVPAGGDGPAMLDGAPAWQVLPRGGRPLEDAVMAAAADLGAAAGGIAGVLFVDAEVALQRACLATCAALLAGDDRIGVVAGWLGEAEAGAALHVPPNPARPHVWHDDRVTPCVALRVEALAAAAAPTRLRAAQAVTEAGWTAVTFPGVFGIMAPGPARARRRGAPVRYSSMAGAVQRLHTPLLQWLRTCSPADRRAFVADGMRSPGRSVRWLAGRAVRAWRVVPAPAAVSPEPPNDRDDEGRRNAARRTN